MSARPFTFGSLFSGFGGLDLGFERAGMSCKWQVEINEYARAVLQKHWPNIPKYNDVREFPPPEGDFGVDLICGGFPCKQVSNARTAQVAKPEGLKGKDSGLWFQFSRIIRSVRPRWVVVENVGSLSTRGLETVLRELSTEGYDCEWACLSAAALGAPHLRKRLFVVGVQDAHKQGLEGYVGTILAQPGGWRQHANARRSSWGDSAPRLCGGASGIPARMVGARERLTGLGNAVVPEVGFFIGKRIMEAEAHARNNH